MSASTVKDAGGIEQILLALLYGARSRGRFAIDVSLMAILNSKEPVVSARGSNPEPAD